MTITILYFNEKSKAIVTQSKAIVTFFQAVASSKEAERNLNEGPHYSASQLR